jgi:hypothetical protein
MGVLAVRVVFSECGVGGDAVAEEVSGGGDHGVDGAGHRGVLVGVVRGSGVGDMREIGGFCYWARDASGSVDNRGRTPSTGRCALPAGFLT